MPEVESPGGVFRFSHRDDPAAIRDPLPGERIPMFVCLGDGLVTTEPGEGRQEIGELDHYDMGEVVVRVYRSAMSDELREALAAPPLVFRNV